MTDHALDLSVASYAADQTPPRPLAAWATRTIGSSETTRQTRRLGTERDNTIQHYTERNIRNDTRRYDTTLYRTKRYNAIRDETEEVLYWRGWVLRVRCPVKGLLARSPYASIRTSPRVRH